MSCEVPLETIERDHPVIVFEFSCEMTERVGGVSPRDHLQMFESYGYELSLIEQPTGSLIPEDDIDRLLDGWGPRGRIEDFVARFPGAAKGHLSGADAVTALRAERDRR